MSNDRDTSAPVLAFDVGGTRIKAGLISANSQEEIRQQVLETPQRIEDVLESLRSMGKDLAGDSKVGSCGLCVPGLVSDEGVVTDLPGKLEGIVGRDLRAELRSLTDGPIVVVNDAIAYALGEAVSGAGMGIARAVVMTIGTGIGVTVIDGQLPLGSGSLGGGILGGMIPISESTDLVDSGGNPGSIEALCSAQRIVDYSRSAGGSQASVEQVYEDFAKGESSAIAGIDLYRSHLVRALSAIAHAHAPQMIILGGGPMTADNPITPGLEDELGTRLWGGFKVEIRLAELGDSAALWGLAHLCRKAA